MLFYILFFSIERAIWNSKKNLHPVNQYLQEQLANTLLHGYTRRNYLATHPSTGRGAEQRMVQMVWNILSCRHILRFFFQFHKICISLSFSLFKMAILSFLPSLFHFRLKITQFASFLCYLKKIVELIIVSCFFFCLKFLSIWVFFLFLTQKWFFPMFPIVWHFFFFNMNSWSIWITKVPPEK